MANLRELTFETPAKINLFLCIQNRRPDGYHDLITDLVPVSVFDSITLSRKEKGGIDFETNLDTLSSEDNLAIKAIRLLEKQTGESFSLKVKLSKTIPVGAGLGGGSGNAAGVLNVMNQWYKLEITDSNLKEMALSLGADVPFFLNPKPSLARGIGEKLMDLPVFTPLSLLLMYPGFSISTRFAYSICRISARKGQLANYTSDGLSYLQPEINDFWIPLSREYPELDKCRHTILEQGAVFCGLSGSGSTLFGVFRDHSTRDQAYLNLENQKKWTIIKCSSLPDYTYI